MSGVRWQLEDDKVYKYLAFDLDGTLLSSDKTIDGKTAKILHDLNSIKESIIILVSGRHINEMTSYIKTLDLNSKCYYISSDGQYIYNGLLELIHIEPYIETWKVEKVLEKLNNTTALIVTRTGDYLVDPNWFRRVFKRFKTLVKGKKQRIYGYKDILTENISEIEKIVLYNNVDFKPVEDIFNIHVLDEGRIELLNKEVSKYVALKYLSDCKKIKLDELLYFGDDMNDYECFYTLENTVAMANASEKIKQLARFQTEDCDHGGIYNMLSKIDATN